MAVDATRDALISRRVLRNVLSNYAGKLIALAAGFLLTPFVLSRLGVAEYGLWALVGSVVAYVSLLDFGVAGAVIKYVAEHRAKGENEQAHHLTATALWIYTGLGLVALLISLVLAFLFPRLFNLAPGQQSQATWLVVLMGAGLGVSIPCAMPSAVLIGLQRYDIVNLVRAAGTLLAVTATVVVLSLGGGVLGMAAVNILVTLLMQVPSVWFIRRIAPELRFGWRGAQRAQVRRVASFSASMFVMNVSGQVQTKTDEIVIGLSMPISAVTPYAIARRLSEMAQIMADQFMKVLMPLASELEAGEGRERLAGLYVTGTRLTLVLLLPIGLTLIFLAKPLLTVWVGEPYAAYAHLVVILTLASVIDTSQWPAGSVLQGMARHQPLALTSIVAAAANLGLSLLLARTLGLTGVALGTLIPTAAVCLGLVLPYALRTIGVSAGAAFRQVLIPAVAPAVPAVLGLVAVGQAFDLSAWPMLIVAGGIGVGLYWVSYLIAGASQAERRAYQGVARDAARDAARLVSGYRRRP